MFKYAKGWLAVALTAACLLNMTACFSRTVTRPPSSGQTTADPSVQGTRPVENAVFSDGKIPPMPVSDGSTAVLQGIASANAILVDAEGRVIAQKDPDARFSPASLTKVMTLIVACENLPLSDLDRRLTLTQDITDYVTSGSYAGSSVGLIDGDKYLNDEFFIRDLLYGIGVASSADCTVMVAAHICPGASVGDSEVKFVELMNRKAAALGLTQTHFDNVIGNESADNYSTARELAVIMAYAMQSELIAKILSTEDYAYKGYYIKDGAEASYNRYMTSTFANRIPTYERYVGSSFTLRTAKMTGNKTGSFVTEHFIACALESKTDGGDYVLILGASSKTDAQPASVGTLKDIKQLADTYIK